LPPEASSLSRGGLFLRLSILQAATFAGFGVLMPFWPAWLSSSGFRETEIGFAMALGMVVRTLAAQPVSALGDRRFGAVKVLVTIQLLYAAVYLAMPAAGSIPVILALMVLSSIFSAATVPLADHLTLSQVKGRAGMDPSRIRLWGSASFLMMSILSGVLVERLGVGVVPWMVLVCALLAALAATASPEAPPAPKPAEDRTAAPVGGWALWLALGASALVNASHAALYGFGTLHWRTLGFPDDWIGVLWAAGVVAEIAMFWWLGPRAASSVRLGAICLGASALAATLRFALMPEATSYAAVLALQVSHAFTFSLQWMGTMTLIGALAHPNRRASAQGWLTAANACLTGAATILSGWLFSAFGAKTFLAMAPIALMGLVLVAALWPRLPKEQPQAEAHARP
jgi:PPP family 3-phenylpropionic acid transporter